MRFRVAELCWGIQSDGLVACRPLQVERSIAGARSLELQVLSCAAGSSELFLGCIYHFGYAGCHPSKGCTYLETGRSTVT